MMNTVRHVVFNGLVAGLLALVLLAGSAARVPARAVDAVSSPADLPVALHAARASGGDAVLPHGAELPAPAFERMVPEGSSGTGALFSSVRVGAGLSSLEAGQVPARVDPLRRFALLHVYRC